MDHDERMALIQSVLISYDAAFLREVRRFRAVGYGRMLQLISHEYYRMAIDEGYPSSGVLVADTCLGLMSKRKQADFIAGYNADPLFGPADDRERGR